MSRQTITLALEGRPSLGDYVTALSSWRELIDLSSDNFQVSWEIEGLEVSSAIATVVGISEDEASLRRATEDVLQVGRDLRDHGSPSNPRYAAATRRLIGVLNERVPYLRLENDREDVTIGFETAASAVVVIPESSPNLGPTFGAVEGRIQTVSNRGSLRFTLYDLTFDKAVSCYLDGGQADLLRDAWGRLAIVEGVVSRQRDTGRPLIIRHVSNITPLQEGLSEEWRSAAGALRNYKGNERSEQTIRRLRNA